MPKATEEQRQAFGAALTEAISTAYSKAENFNPSVRGDVWLAGKVHLSSQAIRNYMSGIREPRNAGIVAAMEAALDLEPHALGRHLGYGESVTQQIADLSRRVDRLTEQIAAILQQQAGRPAPRAARSSGRARRGS